MELFYLVVGLGLGFLGSRLTRVVQEPVVPAESEAQQDESQNLQPIQEQLKQTQLAYQMAKEISQFKAGFLARTSHELRSPLSSLIGMHQLILSDLCDSPEEEREFVAQANASAMKMVKLLDEVVDISKTEHGTNRLEIRSLPLARVFDDLHVQTHLQAANRNIPLEIIAPNPAIYVVADARRFCQVLRVLVDSAIAQMHEGSIRVSASSLPDEREAHIWIDIQSPDRIWSEPVDLLSQTPDKNEHSDETGNVSPGLTLLMAQSLIEVMQGRLELLPISDKPTKSDSTETSIRLQCSMPLGSPEPVEQASVEG